MRRLIAMILAAMMMLSLAACTASEPAQTNGDATETTGAVMTGVEDGVLTVAMHAFWGQLPREEPVGARLSTVRNDTTSELSGGNAGTGAPVIVLMSGGLVRNQGGTVEYIIYYVSHP